MMKLGHIIYSNVFPVHALLVSERAPAGIEIVRGIPSELNRMLAAGQIDAAPCSSIEYARHVDQYRLLPGFVIGSDGPVGSILFESARPIEALGNTTIQVPTASATSVLLLQILLQLKYGIAAQYRWFTQDEAIDPLAEGAAAALWIGDVALRRNMPADRHVYDLGAEWKSWTGLPFVFAAWQTGAPAARDAELRDLVAALHASRTYFLANARSLAEQNSKTFGIPANRLFDYWNSLHYEFDEPMQRGVLKYFELAAELGAVAPVAQLRFVR